MIPYTVYCHVFPNGKAYFGITSQDTNSRWGHGRNYGHNRRMYEDIQYYGWNNVKHDVLVERVTETAARQLECVLMRKFDTLDPEKGYNVQSWDKVWDAVKDKEGLLEKHGLDDYVPEAIPGSIEKAEEERKMKLEIERIEELRKQAQWQMFNWIESINNPLPIYDDPEYQKIFQEELEREKAAQKRAEKKRKDAHKAYQARHALSEIEAYEREKWAKISQQRATYEKWKRNR